MNAHRQIAPAMGWAEKADARLGRTDWVWADYIAEGYRQFDALFAASGKTFGPAWVPHRRMSARAWAEINCPPSKRGKAALGEPVGRRAA